MLDYFCKIIGFCVVFVLCRLQGACDMPSHAGQAGNIGKFRCHLRLLCRTLSHGRPQPGRGRGLNVRPRGQSDLTIHHDAGTWRIYV